MALACRVEFDIPRGLTVPLQAVFVPMLLLLPAAAVVPAVVVALALGQLPDVLRGRQPASRLTISAGNAGSRSAPRWYSPRPAIPPASSTAPCCCRSRSPSSSLATSASPRCASAGSAGRRCAAS